tara:strand:- start:194 stop:1126 length:933 start_codon:yes stop_codon:yes gene_type:complete
MAEEMKKKNAEVYPATVKVGCAVCGGKRERFLYRVDGYRLVRCRDCGLAFLNPRPSVKELDRFYDQYFQDQVDPDGKKRNYYAEKDVKLKAFYDEYLKLEGFLKRRKGKILDVGCAAGYFLESMPDSWERYGVEYDKSCAREANKIPGVTVKAGSLLKAKYGKEFFDVVALLQTIEHMPDPSENIAECSRILKKGGILYVTTPNFGSMTARVFKANHRLITAPAHLYYFTPKTLGLLLKKHGFKVVKVHYPYFETNYFKLGDICRLYGRVFLVKAGYPLLKGLGLIRKVPPVVSLAFYKNMMDVYAVKIK